MIMIIKYANNDDYSNSRKSLVDDIIKKANKNLINLAMYKVQYHDNNAESIDSQIKSLYFLDNLHILLEVILIIIKK